VTVLALGGGSKSKPKLVALGVKETLEVLAESTTDMPVIVPDKFAVLVIVPVNEEPEPVKLHENCASKNWQYKLSIIAIIVFNIIKSFKLLYKS
jgi:hypothetical protein